MSDPSRALRLFPELRVVPRLFVYAGFVVAGTAMVKLGNLYSEPMRLSVSLVSFGMTWHSLSNATSSHPNPPYKSYFEFSRILTGIFCGAIFYWTFRPFLFKLLGD
jgi:hypothetical protein